MTVLMLTYVFVGLTRVNLVLTDSKNDVLGFGFVNIYNGTYVKDVGPEWLLSLTAPSVPSATAPGGNVEISRGFGAPLWVLLLSITGSALFTILIIFRGIIEEADFGKPEDVARRVEEVMRHQFYILFSPLGAVFVYQIMIVGGLCSQNITVALIALASGVVLSLLLDKALVMAKSILDKYPNGPAATTPGQVNPPGPVASQPPVSPTQPAIPASAKKTQPVAPQSNRPGVSWKYPALHDQIQAALDEQIGLNASHGAHGITYRTGTKLDFVATSRSGTKVAGFYAIGSEADFSLAVFRELFNEEPKLSWLIIALPAGQSFAVQNYDTQGLPKLLVSTDANEIAEILLRHLAEPLKLKPLTLK